MFSFIIPNFNGKEYLENCLASIFQQKGRQKEIIVVDNGSTDGSREYLKKLKVKSEKLRVVLNNKNLGFARAVNQGIEEAKYPYLVVMNNDLKLAPDWLEEVGRGIERWEKREKIAAFFGKVLDWEGKRVESTSLIYNLSGKASNRSNGQPIEENRDNREEIIWGGPASVIIYKKAVLEKTGFFDSLFFAYLEDVDLNLRLNSFGFKTVYLPKAVAYHQGGGTADRIGNMRYRLVARNWWFIILKHYSLVFLLKNFPKILLEQSKNFLKAEGLGGKVWVIEELIKKWPKIIRKRKPLLF